MYDVTALGELLIDFTPHGTSNKGHLLFECNPGGAPANVLAAVAKLGKKTAFIGKVGMDAFGDLLKQSLEKKNIDVLGLKQTPEYPTTLAFIHLSPTGDRSFSFYRNPSADTMLEAAEVNTEGIKASKIFHFGSVSMTTEPTRSATLAAIKVARDAGCFLSYDPNIRPLLWHSPEEAKRVILSCMEACDVLKLSLEEMLFLSGTENLEEATLDLYNRYQIPLIFITMGKEGSFYRANGWTGKVAAFDVKTIDTTGAGDAFVGAVLYQLLEKNKDLQSFHQTELNDILLFASAASSLATTQYGAMGAMPDLDAIQECMTSIPKLKYI